MAVPVAALMLQMLGTTAAPRCTGSDASKCATDGLADLISASGGGGVGSDRRDGRFGLPSSALTLTFMFDKAAAWADLPGAELRVPPPEVRGIPVLMPSGQFAAGSDVVFHCPRFARDVCDAWVFFYSCPQSCSIAFQGGVPGQLAADGWDHTICAPRFVTGVPSGFAHQMRSYRTKIQPGDTVKFTTAAKAEFLAFGLDMGGVTCSKYTDETMCTAAPNAACKWSPMGECYPTDCRRGGHGPPPPCTECPWEGITRRPASDGPFN